MRCLECLKNAPKKDGIIFTQYNFIQFQDTTITELQLNLVDLNRKKKRNLKLGLGFGGITGFLLSVFMFSLIK